MSSTYYTIDYKGYPDPVIKASGSTYYIDYGAVNMDGLNGDHLQTNPNCTELPCPAGTTNQGTFYNHTAATAGAGLGEAADTIVIDSICPSGWMLPAFNATENKSLYSLFISAYGGRIVDSGGTNADVIVLYPPLSFLRSGYYYSTTTIINNSGIEGRYWGARPHSTGNTASTLYLKTASLSKANSNKGWGYPIRCVSRD